jgi:hypothetical protein
MSQSATHGWRQRISLVFGTRKQILAPVDADLPIIRDAPGRPTSILARFANDVG